LPDFIHEKNLKTGIKTSLQATIAERGKLKRRAIALLFNLPFVSAMSAGASVVSLKFSCSSAIKTPLWLVFESLFPVEFLFSFGKCEFSSAILADQYFVSHFIYLLNLFGLNTS
jgi:hypothetical protein